MVLASGCFDGLHAGHVRYLEACALVTGAKPIVAIAPDDVIREKGHEPWWTQRERLETVKALRGVEGVIAQAALTPAAIIRAERPGWFVKGIDWEGKLPQDVIDACREVNCTIVYVDTPGRHVSEARG